MNRNLLIRILVIIPILILLISSIPYKSTPKCISSWKNIDTSNINPNRLILFDSLNLIIVEENKWDTSAQSYIISSDILGSKCNSGIKLRLNDYSGHVEAFVSNDKGLVQDTLIGLFKYIGDDTLVISWSNDWNSDSVLKFVKDKNLPNNELKVLKSVYSFIEDFYANFDKNISIHYKRPSESKMFGGDKSVYKTIKKNKYKLIPKNIEFRIINDTLVDVNFILLNLKRNKVEKKTSVNTKIRFRNNQWKIKMEVVLGKPFCYCGLLDNGSNEYYDLYFNTVKSVLAYKNHTAKDYFRDSLLWDQIEKQRIIDSTKMSDSLKIVQLEQQRVYDSIMKSDSLSNLIGQ